MAGVTEHYGLKVWGEEDEFKGPEGLNGNFETVDEALGEKAELVVGSYTGDGADGRIVELGFTPKSVLIFRKDGMAGSSNSYVYGGMVLETLPLQTSSYVAAKIVDNGFEVYLPYDRICINVSGQIYYYWALRG